MLRLQVTSNEYYDRSFISWLINEICNEILLSLDIKKVSAWTTMMNTLQGNNVLTVKDVLFVIRRYTRQLYATRLKDGWQIIFEPRGMLKNVDMSAIQFFMLLENGTLEIPGLHIISNTFSRIKKDVPVYFDRYLEEG